MKETDVAGRGGIEGRREYLLMFGRDESQGKREDIHSRQEENGRDAGSSLWRQRCLEC